jgi:hypothetical protein
MQEKFHLQGSGVEKEQAGFGKLRCSQPMTRLSKPATLKKQDAIWRV